MTFFYKCINIKVTEEIINPPHIIIAVVHIFMCLYLYIFPVPINTCITAKN